MNEVELEAGYPPSFFIFHLPVIITPLLCIHLLPCRQMCGSPDQAVILSQLCSFSEDFVPDLPYTWSQSKKVYV